MSTCDTGTPQTDIDDLELVERIRAGDTSAWKALHKKHWGSTVRAAQRITREKDEAEDIAQEAFVKAREKIASFDFKKGPFSAWLRRIAENTAKDAKRKSKKRPTTSLDEKTGAKRPALSDGDDEGAALDTFGPVDHETPDVVLEADELERAVASITKTLPAKALAARQDGQSWETIGAALDCSPDAARKAADRAEKSLLRELQTKKDVLPDGFGLTNKPRPTPPVDYRDGRSHSAYVARAERAWCNPLLGRNSARLTTRIQPDYCGTMLFYEAAKSARKRKFPPRDEQAARDLVEGYLDRVFGCQT